MNDDILKLAAVALISLAVGGAAAVGLVEPAVTGEPPLSDGTDQLSAVEICEMPQTEVFLVTDTASGEKQYQAKHVTSTVRYDLTWQTDNPEAIAVEELRGQDFRPRAEQYSAEFAACIAGKNVVPVQGSH
jgi:hypothetical protein